MSERVSEISPEQIIPRFDHGSADGGIAGDGELTYGEIKNNSGGWREFEELLASMPGDKHAVLSNLDRASRARSEDVLSATGDYRATFLARPKTRHELRQDDKPNLTWARMTASLGVAYDRIMDGRAIDGDLLYELARYGKDDMEQMAAAAELAAMGAIDGKAFEQITNNTNYKGTDTPLVERLAFALAIKRHGGQKTLEQYFRSRSPWSSERTLSSTPLQVLHHIVGSNSDFASWKKQLVASAQRLLGDAMKGKLLESAAFAELLRQGLGPRGKVATQGMSVKGLLAYSAAWNSDRYDEARRIARQAESGGLDVVTLATLARGGKPVYFVQRFADNASLGRVDFDTARQVASDVAAGHLSYGQIYGFFMEYARTDERSRPKLDLLEGTRIIRAVNARELKSQDVAYVLDPKAYFPKKLAQRIWRRMFSGSDHNGGKYTVTGVLPESTYTQPLTSRLTASLVSKLASDPEAHAAFTAKFEEKLSDALPSALKMFWWRLTKPRSERWESGLYEQYVDQAFERASLHVDHWPRT